MSEHHYERKYHTCALCSRFVDGDGQPSPLCDECFDTAPYYDWSTRNDDDEADRFAVA
jgi:hypothetical protein